MAVTNKVLTGYTLRVMAQVAPLGAEEQLLVLESAWMATARHVRQEALVLPDGFSAAKAKQLMVLQSFAGLIEGDAPDPHSAQMWQEGDVDGILRRLREAGRERKVATPEPA